MTDLRMAVDQQRPADAIPLAKSILADEPGALAEAEAAGLGLAAAGMLDDYAEMKSMLGSLDEALTDLGPADPQGAEPTPKNKVRTANEEILRDSHATLAETAKDHDKALELSSMASDVYKRHYPDALLLGEVLWREGELMRRKGKLMEAIEAYEVVREKDLTGEYRAKALEQIVSAWTRASETSPLPEDVVEKAEIPSPHKEWLAIVEDKLAAEPDAADVRSIELRRQDILFAYKQIDEETFLLATTEIRHRHGELNKPRYLIRVGEILLSHERTDQAYGKFREVIQSEEPKAAVQAATLMIKHAAEHSSNKEDFRSLRKELQANKQLWQDRDFRVLIFKLRDEVEGG